MIGLLASGCVTPHAHLPIPLLDTAQQYGKANVSVRWPTAGKAYLILQTVDGESRAKRLAFDRDGNLYFTSNLDQTVRKIDRSTGALSKVAGQPNVTSDATALGNDGPAGAASLNYPMALAISPENRLFISDYLNHQIRLIHL